MKIIYTDVLVIGGGLAGLRIGIGAKRRGHDVIILSRLPRRRSHSAAAQGGMKASLGNVIKAKATTRTCTLRIRCAAVTGAPIKKSSGCSSTLHPKRRASLLPGAYPGAALPRATAMLSSTDRKSRSPSAKKLMA